MVISLGHGFSEGTKGPDTAKQMARTIWIFQKMHLTLTFEAQSLEGIWKMRDWARLSTHVSLVLTSSQSNHEDSDESIQIKSLGCDF